MIDINLIRNQPDLVRENIKKKFQDAKLPLVDEVIDLDLRYRAAIQEADSLRSKRRKISRQIGALIGQGKKEEAEEAKAEVSEIVAELADIEVMEGQLQEQIRERMLLIPQIIDPTVPLGPDDTHNVELERFGEPVVPDYEIPYHVT